MHMWSSYASCTGLACCCLATDFWITCCLGYQEAVKYVGKSHHTRQWTLSFASLSELRVLEDAKPDSIHTDRVSAHACWIQCWNLNKTASVFSWAQSHNNIFRPKKSKEKKIMNDAIHFYRINVSLFLSNMIWYILHLKK